MAIGSHKKTYIIHVTTLCVTKIKYITCMYNVQDYNILYNNGFRPVICKDCYFTNIWKALAWPHHFTKIGCLGSYNVTLVEPCHFVFIEVPVPSQKNWECRFCIFLRFWFWNCSESLWYFCLYRCMLVSQPTISLEMPVPSQGHYGFHSFPVVDWFCLFIYLWVLTFPL